MFAINLWNFLDKKRRQEIFETVARGKYFYRDVLSSAKNHFDWRFSTRGISGLRHCSRETISFHYLQFFVTNIKRNTIYRIVIIRCSIFYGTLANNNDRWKHCIIIIIYIKTDQKLISLLLMGRCFTHAEEHSHIKRPIGNGKRDWKGYVHSILKVRT